MHVAPFVDQGEPIGHELDVLAARRVDRHEDIVWFHVTVQNAAAMGFLEDREQLDDEVDTTSQG